MMSLWLIILILILSFPFSAGAVKVSGLKDTISDSRESATGVKHTLQWTGSANNLKCIQISLCTTATGACVAPAGLDSTGSSKGNFSGISSLLWSLDSSLNGTLKLVNALGENPAANVSLEFLGINNPATSGSYYSRVATYSDDTCLAQVDYGITVFNIIGSGLSVSVTILSATPAPVPGPGGGGGAIAPGSAKVIFEGKAYPGAFITFLKNGQVSGTTVAKDSGDFTLTLTGLSQGTWSFGFFAEDTEKRKSVTLSFSANILGGTETTISGIFISPTITLNGSSVKRGGAIDILGQAYPNSEVNIFVSSPVAFTKKTAVSDAGKWKYSFDTSPLELGMHSAKAKAIILSGEQSPFSEDMTFKVIEACQGADLNFDGKVNLIDFSILLYFWNQSKPSNACADINRDNKGDLTDFSIMMYWWTR